MADWRSCTVDCHTRREWHIERDDSDADDLEGGDFNYKQEVMSSIIFTFSLSFTIFFILLITLTKAQYKYLKIINHQFQYFSAKLKKKSIEGVGWRMKDPQVSAE